MNKNSRTTNVIRNIVGGVGGQLFTSILQFVCRTIFIRILGATYLGVNGLFANILSMLSLAELGIGPAIVFCMYKPIAQNDEEKIAKLMNFYKSAYRMVALVVLLIGLLLTPFLEFFIKDTSSIENIRLIFILILMNTVVSYLYAYKGSMLNADQKAYIVVIIRNIFAVVQNILQMIILFITGNFLVYLIVQIITTFAANVFQANYVDRKYPFLKKYGKAKLDVAEKKDIIKRVRGMMLHKVGGFVLNSTDNLVISKFVGIVAVGIYSNYLMIINLVKTYVTQITGSVSASVGNLLANEDKNKAYGIFNSMLMAYFWMYGFCFISFWVIFQPFMVWWLGDAFLMKRSILFVVLINLYLNGFQECSNTFINATGLFWETRYKPVAECIINLVISIFLAWKIGLAGVFIGTTVSFLCTFWVNPLLLYKKVFNKKLSIYLVKFSGYTFLAIGTAIGLDLLTMLFPTIPVFYEIIIRICMCAVIPNALFCIIFWRTKGFNYFKQIIKSFIKHKTVKR